MGGLVVRCAVLPDGGPDRRLDGQTAAEPAAASLRSGAGASASGGKVGRTQFDDALCREQALVSATSPICFPLVSLYCSGRTPATQHSVTPPRAACQRQVFLNAVRSLSNPSCLELPTTWVLLRAGSSEDLGRCIGATAFRSQLAYFSRNNCFLQKAHGGGQAALPATMPRPKIDALTPESCLSIALLRL